MYVVYTLIRLGLNDFWPVVNLRPGGVPFEGLSGRNKSISNLWSRHRRRGEGLLHLRGGPVLVVEQETYCDPHGRAEHGDLQPQ